MKEPVAENPAADPGKVEASEKEATNDAGKVDGGAREPKNPSESATIPENESGESKSESPPSSKSEPDEGK